MSGTGQSSCSGSGSGSGEEPGGRLRPLLPFPAAPPGGGQAVVQAADTGLHQVILVTVQNYFSFKTTHTPCWCI